MPGRFAIFTDKEEVEKTFDVHDFETDIRPNYNAAPTHMIAVIVGNTVKSAKWGIKLGKYTLINIRSDSMEKPFIKNLEPCIIIVNGYFEWQDKVPKFITLEDRKLIGFAGLYHDNHCSMLTTEPNDFVKPIHERMPVIIPSGKEREWLSTKSTDLLKPSEETMQAVTVSTLVNSIKHNMPECIKPVGKNSKLEF